jgi:hypothetical protein
MITKTPLLLPILLIFSSCSTKWLESNTTKAVLSEIGTMVFNAAVQSFTSESKVDLGHSMAQGLWQNPQMTAGSIKRIADAWSADRLHKLSTEALKAYAYANPQNSKQQAQVTDAIASAISHAAEQKGL